MGYYTNFKLKAVNAKGRTIPLPPIGELGGHDWECCNDRATPGDVVKWYDHEKDMLAFSQMHPDTIFVLDGEGEEQGDVWRMFFLAGQSHTWKAPKIEPPELSLEILEQIGGVVMR